MNASPSPYPRDAAAGSPLGLAADEDLQDSRAGIDGDFHDDDSDPEYAHSAAGQPAPAVRGTTATQSTRLPAEACEEQIAVWIDHIVDRDERALAALYDATLSRVYGLVLRVVRRPALADEVVEDTYFQVWRQAVRFDPARGRALPWLLGMARSRAIDAVRREARFQHDSLDAESGHEVEFDTPPADDLLDAARGHADLHQALLQLNAQPRQLVALAFFRGLSHEEIASHTALPLGTVKSQIRRALITLRQALGDSGLRTLAS